MERVTGIEPALSAWEARGGLHRRSSEHVYVVAAMPLWVRRGLARADDMLVEGSCDGVVAAGHGVLIAEGGGAGSVA